MKYRYGSIEGIELTYSDIKRVGFEEVLPVYFERDDGRGGFDFAEGIAPACTFQRSSGFSGQELSWLQQFLRNNLMLLWEDAKEAAAA